MASGGDCTDSTLQPAREPLVSSQLTTISQALRLGSHHAWEAKASVPDSHHNLFAITKERKRKILKTHPHGVKWSLWFSICIADEPVFLEKL